MYVQWRKNDSTIPLKFAKKPLFGFVFETFVFSQMKVGTQQMNKHVTGSGSAALSQGVDIHINILDQNDNNPIFVPSEAL
jgi:hypothetical protein